MVFLLAVMLSAIVMSAGNKADQERQKQLDDVVNQESVAQESEYER